MQMFASSKLACLFCLKTHKLICPRINVKLGGINTVPDPASSRGLTDPANPTIVMGADVIHPAPGSEGRPSFTSVVGNVDSDIAKYIATTKVQESRREMIDDLEEMSFVCTADAFCYIHDRANMKTGIALDRYV